MADNTAEGFDTLTGELKTVHGVREKKPAVVCILL